MATHIPTVQIPFDARIANTFTPTAFEFGYKRYNLLFPEGILETAKARASNHLEHLIQRTENDQTLLYDLLYLAEWETGCRPEYRGSDGSRGIFAIHPFTVYALALNWYNELDYTEAGLRLWVTARAVFPNLYQSMEAYNLFYALRKSYATGCLPQKQEAE
jgi:hypothetical protein